MHSLEIVFAFLIAVVENSIHFIFGGYLLDPGNLPAEGALAGSLQIVGGVLRILSVFADGLEREDQVVVLLLRVFFAL